MAITVTPEITGQVASSAFTYCYLFEPLRVLIEESNLAGTKIYIDIDLIEMGSLTVVETLAQYAEFDINPGNPVSVDLMKLAQQLDNADVYKIGQKNDWVYGPEDRSDLFSMNMYRHRMIFKIYTDVTATPIEVRKFPIRGGRSYDVFFDSPGVDENSPISEFEYYGVPTAGIVIPLPEDDSDQIPRYRWGDIWSVYFQLNPPNATSAFPNVTIDTRDTTFYPTPCAGAFLIWKSRFGGWMHWAFDAKQEKSTKKYEGQIEVGMFDRREQFITGQGSTFNPYISPDYTKISYEYTRTLKAYSLKQEELLLLKGIDQSPAVYYCETLDTNVNERAELMRVTSLSLPIDTKTRGGDVTIQLKSISTQHQNVR